MHQTVSNTRWSRINAARKPDSECSFEALSVICEDYWYPIYGHLRNQGISVQDSQDITQGFLSSIIREGHLGGVEIRGRSFRSVIIGALEKYRSQPEKEGLDSDDSVDTSWAENRLASENLDPRLDPENAFDRRWAILLLEKGMKLLCAEYYATGRGEEFETLKSSILGIRVRTHTKRSLGRLVRVSEMLRLRFFGCEKGCVRFSNPNQKRDSIRQRHPRYWMNCEFFLARESSPLFQFGKHRIHRLAD